MENQHKMSNQFPVSKNEILETLKRSGYLFESEIIKQLHSYGFFTEPNVVSLDPVTGKSREIDVIAEYQDFSRLGERVKENVYTKVKFVFEIKRNDFPVVVMTKAEYSTDVFIWNGFKDYVTVPDEYSGLNVSFYEVLVGNKELPLYTQYCSFSKKKEKDELLAHHPENLYSALSKITYYCEDSLKKKEAIGLNRKDEILRSILYLPILLIDDDLYELNISERNKSSLKRVECSRLVFNYHFKQEAALSIVYVVTRRGLKDLLIKILNAERIVSDDLIRISKGQIVEREL